MNVHARQEKTMSKQTYKLKKYFCLFGIVVTTATSGCIAFCDQCETQNSPTKAILGHSNLFDTDAPMQIILSADFALSDFDFYEILSNPNIMIETRIKALCAMLSETDNPLSFLLQYFGKPDHIEFDRTFNADSFDSFFFGEMTSYVLFYSSISANDMVAVSFDIGGRFSSVRWLALPVEEHIQKWKGFLASDQQKKLSTFIRRDSPSDKILNDLVDFINKTITTKHTWNEWLIFLRGNDDILKFQVGAIKADPTSVIVSSVDYRENIGWAILEFQFPHNRQFYALVFFTRNREQWSAIPLNKAFSSKIDPALTD